MQINMTPVTLPRAMGEWTVKVQHCARRALRDELREIGSLSDLRHDDSACDALIESVWNAIVKASGHDDLARS